MSTFLEELLKNPTVNVYQSDNFIKNEFDPSIETDFKRLIVTWISEDNLKSILTKYQGNINFDIPREEGLFSFREDLTYRICHPFTDGLKANQFLPIEEHLKQSLLSIDAVARDLRTGKLLDPFNGIEDLKRRRIRIVNDTLLGRFPIKILEILAFSSKYGYELTASAKASIHRYQKHLSSVENESFGYILDEVIKKNKAPKAFFDLLDSFGILSKVMPKLSNARFIVQGRKAGVMNVMEHSLLSLNAARPFKPEVRWAALYHDLGKTATAKEINSKTRYFGHEKVSAKWAYKDLLDWGFGKEFARSVSHLILHHMFDGGPQLTDDAVKRLIRRVGTEHIFDLLDLRLADSAGFIGKPTGIWKVNKLRSRISQELAKNPFSIKGLKVNHADVERITQIKEPIIQENILNYMLVLVLAQKLENNTNALLTWLHSTNFEKIGKFCPMGLEWILDQHRNRIENKADENMNGTLKCGKFCGYKCDNNEKDLWTL